MDRQPLLQVMAKDSSVNFINKSDQTVRIRSADKRFDAFNLAPGEEVRKTDSISGVGNNDIDADILVNPPGRGNSEFLGNFKFNNRVLDTSYAQSREFMMDSRVTLGGQKFYSVFADEKGTRDWGFVSESTLDKMTAYYSGGYLYGYFWRGSVSPFETGYKISTTDFGTGGPNGDQKRWDLVIVELPPV